MTAAEERWAAGEVRATPALVVDEVTCRRNVDAMAASAAGRSLLLRPHAKTHKSPALAARQLAAGAVGLSVATVGEAEALAGRGIGDLFVAYPLWAADDLGGRLRELAERVTLSVGCDSAGAAALLGRAVAGGPRPTVLVEVDSGLHRTGVPPDRAGEVGVAVRSAGLEVGGAFTFPGHGYGPGRAPDAVADERRALAAAAASLEAAGIPCPVRSGGSTPTAAGASGGVVTEIRPGVYVFGDAQQLALGHCRPEDLALAAIATVVSVAGETRCVLDAGSKILGADRYPWVEGSGLLPDLPSAVVAGLWEHHAVVDLSGVEPAARPRLGQRVAIVPNHVCTAVNLVDELLVASAGHLVDRWAVAARGANR